MRKVQAQRGVQLDYLGLDVRMAYQSKTYTYYLLYVFIHWCCLQAIGGDA